MFFIYSIVSRVYISCIHLAAVFHAKARKAIQGRKGFFTRYPPADALKEKYIWFHCASLGEFEQGRPVIEKIKKDFPEKKILLSFFSPSGYEIKKNYDFADEVVYLPFDTPGNARKFLRSFPIEMAVFVKYDLWPFYLRECFRQHIPVILMSAVFRNDHFIFRWYGKFIKDLLAQMKCIFVQDPGSKAILMAHGLTNVEVAGDTRMDRVVQIRDENHQLAFAEKFIRGKKLVVWGSIWPEDEPVIDSFLHKKEDNILHIIAPHSIHETYLHHLEKKYSRATRLSKYEEGKKETYILIIDNIGMLNKLYRYASVAYVGGGFGKSIHNILEPAVYGTPVFFGPRFQKFPEAAELIRLELAYSSADPVSLAENMKLCIQDKIFTNDRGKNTTYWIKNATGATSLVVSYLQRFF